MDWLAIFNLALGELISPLTAAYILCAIGLAVHFGFTGLMNFGQAAFAAVGLLSLPPTLRILAWNRALKADAGFTPELADLRATRRLVHIEAAVLLLIPLFAVMIPRIQGL